MLAPDLNLSGFVYGVNLEDGLGNGHRGRLPLWRTSRPLLWHTVGSRPPHLIKTGAKVVSHGRYVTFQLAAVAVPRQMFADILSLIVRLRAPPAPA
jgi:hypothetical protein